MYAFLSIILSFADVKEWLHQNHKRCVKVKIGPEETISTVNRKGEILRKIDFKSVNSLVIEVTRDTHKKPMVLIRSPRDHDLVRGIFIYEIDLFSGPALANR